MRQRQEMFPNFCTRPLLIISIIQMLLSRKYCCHPIYTKFYFVIYYQIQPHFDQRWATNIVFFHRLAQLSSVVEKIVVMPFYLEEKITFYRCQCNEVGPRYWLSVADLQVIPSPLSTRSKNPRQTRIEKVQNNQNRPKNVENQVNWPKISQKHVSYWKHPPQDKKRETHPPNPIANPQTQTPTQFVCLLHRNLLLGLVWHHLPVTFIQWNLKHHKIIIHLYFSSLESLLGLQASST